MVLKSNMINSMRKDKIIVFPNPHKKSLNPYLKDLSDSLHAVNKDEITDANIKNLLKHLFDANIYFFNWPENLIFRKFGYLQITLLFICVIILKIRGVQIVWIFHNIAPHQGHTYLTKVVYKLFLHWSDLIITHSKKALRFIQENSKNKSFYIPHPFRKKFFPVRNHKYQYDMIIWGSIFRYKGIVEFLRSKQDCQKSYKILIIGKCDDREYDRKIRELINSNIRYENRYVEQEELKNLILSARYVLFPYLKNSISSSGALVDSILLGKTVIGPNVGAFQELANEGLCLTFKDYPDIFKIVDEDKYVSQEDIEKYVNNNVWEISAEKIIKCLQL